MICLAHHKRGWRLCLSSQASHSCIQLSDGVMTSSLNIKKMYGRNAEPNCLQHQECAGAVWQTLSLSGHRLSTLSQTDLLNRGSQPSACCARFHGLKIALGFGCPCGVSLQGHSLPQVATDMFSKGYTCAGAASITRFCSQGQNEHGAKTALPFSKAHTPRLALQGPSGKSGNLRQAAGQQFGKRRPGIAKGSP